MSDRPSDPNAVEATEAVGKSGATAARVVVTPPGAAAPRPAQSRLSRVARVAGAIVAAGSLVTGIIAIIPILTRDATNFDSLRIETTPLGGDLEFALPADADLASFPQGAPGVCDTEQQAWLEANGERISTTYLVDVRNVAAEGPMLALTRLRGAGAGDGAALSIRVLCSPTGPSSVSIQAARLLVSDPAQVAYFDKSAFGHTAEGIPDSPVAWNLAPGETGQFALTLFPTQPFAGRLMVTVRSGTEDRDVVVLEDVAVPGLVRGGLTYLAVDGGLSCLRIDGAERVACEIGDLVDG